jgi:hypothetical protein
VDADFLLKAADLAMYRAKEDGGGNATTLKQLHELGGAAFDGRFRHRILQPELSAQFSFRQDEDSSVIIRNLVEDNRSKAIVRAITGLAQKLRHDVHSRRGGNERSAGLPHGHGLFRNSGLFLFETGSREPSLLASRSAGFASGPFAIAISASMSAAPAPSAPSITRLPAARCHGRGPWQRFPC